MCRITPSAHPTYEARSIGLFTFTKKSGPAFMYENIVQLRAPQDRMLYLWFEPWVEGLAFPAGTVVELRAHSPVDGQLELDAIDERTAIYGWPGSTLQVIVADKLIHEFDQAVPVTLSRLSTKENITMLFGPPPKPSK